MKHIPPLCLFLLYFFALSSSSSLPSDLLLGLTTNIWMQEFLTGYNYHKISFKIKFWRHEEYETKKSIQTDCRVLAMSSLLASRIFYFAYFVIFILNLDLNSTVLLHIFSKLTISMNLALV